MDSESIKFLPSYIPWQSYGKWEYEVLYLHIFPDSLMDSESIKFYLHIFPDSLMDSESNLQSYLHIFPDSLMDSESIEFYLHIFPDSLMDSEQP